MSARQAFIPRPLSRMPSSEPHSHPTDVRSNDRDKDPFVNCTGKARSVAAFLGQKRGGTNTTSQGVGPTEGRSNMRSNRRSFEGVLRPEMTSMSITPYPAGTKQPGARQTPRKTADPGVFEFPRPMTPGSMPRGLKKGFGIFAREEDESSSNRNEHGNNHMFMGPGGETDGRVGAGTGGGYMRMFEGSGGGGSTGGLQLNLERDIAAPVPGYALGRTDANPEDEGCEIEGMFAPSSRSLGAIADGEMGVEKNYGLERSVEGTKRGMCHEDVEDSGRYSDEGNEFQGSAKRMKQMQHDPNEYIPISSPHIPPTPGPQTSSVGTLDSSLVVGSFVENMEGFINLEEIEADWKRWKGCTTEEWLKGADELTQEYTDILNLAKDYLTEEVLAYASMISSVEERRTKINRNIERIRGRENIIRENISKLGMKK